jgi:AGZA family xanthine/uracil permease-like MFS transporter
VPGDVLSAVTAPEGWKYLAVIVPMGLFNVIGSLQNLESAEAAGDRFATRPSLLANGIGTLAAAVLGSPFPTTIYIGHPGWKAMGARASYSAINGVVITGLCLAGAMTAVLSVVPLEATLGILLWIGIVITAQAFAEVPSRHTLAVALGLIPALAAWALLLIEAALRTTGAALVDVVGPMATNEAIYVAGIIALAQGFIVSSMLLAATAVHVIERRFVRAAAWMAAASVLSAVGLIHGYELTPAGVATRFFDLQLDVDAANPAAMFAIAYALAAALLLGLHVLAERTPPPEDAEGK